MKSMIEGVYLFPLGKHKDDRGWLTEIFRNDQLKTSPQMGYVSETLPLVVRGPHEHKEQTDYFAFIGPGTFHLHLWKTQEKNTHILPSYEIWEVGETNPALAVIPPGVVHAYKNISDKPGWVFNAPDQLYAGPGKLYKVDEIRHEDCEEKTYQLYEAGWTWSIGGNAANAANTADNVSES